MTELGRLVRNVLSVTIPLSLAACNFAGTSHPNPLNKDGSVRATSEATSAASNGDRGLLPDTTPQPDSLSPSDPYETGETIVNPGNGDVFRVVIDPSVPDGAQGALCAEISQHGQTFISLEDALQAASGGKNKFKVYIYGLQPQPTIIDRNQGEQIPSGVVYFADGAFACVTD